MTNLVVIDFETEAIADRPNYPPKPVGVAISYPDGRNVYMAWGHPSGNNCTEPEAKRTVLNLQKQFPTAYHNAKFDLEVAQKWHGYMPPPDMWHDTMLLAFLKNPHSTTLALKPLSEEILSIPPTERDEVKAWILDNVEGARRKPSQWGAHISKAPADLVGKYAIGDVQRTRLLFDALYADVTRRGMAAAYLRERRLIPILIRNEQEGIACDWDNLSRHMEECSQDFRKVDAWIGKYLGCGEINLDENETLADALEAAGKIEKWEKTEKGMRSTAKPALGRMLKDRLLYAALMYRGSMATCLRTFMLPWLELSSKNNGRLYTTWNTTKQEEGGGTRTGRLSSSKPLNLQNIPNDFSEKFGELFKETKLLDVLDIGELPTMRNYIVADTTGHVLLGRDFSSQEPRTFAHFEGGWLRDQYRANPKMDVYKTLMARTLEQTGIDMTRKQAKVVFLGLLYGMGKDKLAAQLDTSPEEAQKIKDALLTAIPSIRDLTTMVKNALAADDYIDTWGGRHYYVEPEKMIDNVRRSFEYKGLNVLVQGSAADETKEALIRYDAAKGSSRLLLQVHDELVICAPKEDAAHEMKILKECMEGLELSVPMLSEGEAGYRWGMMEAHT